MKIFVILLYLILFFTKSTALDTDNDGDIKWGVFNKTVVDKCSVHKKNKLFFQKCVHNLFNTEWAHWDKLRPIAQQKMSALLAKENAVPLIIFEWTFYSISYNSILLTDKFILRAKSDGNIILLKKATVPKNLNDVFNSNRKLLEHYNGYISESGYGFILYCLTIWKDNKAINTFIFSGLHLNNGQYGSEEEKIIAKIFMGLLNSVQPKKKSQKLYRKKVLSSDLLKAVKDKRK